jgi:hypothetical protein
MPLDLPGRSSPARLPRRGDLQVARDVSMSERTFSVIVNVMAT